tara:strand:+ start:136 stop:489 length:354 start_codon:yes stop_codon:yes gene_type:complete
VYYRAKNLAYNNGRPYHLAAILRRKGSVIKIGENTNKTHPRFKRQHKDGSWSSHMHAEMNVIRFALPGDTLEVIRWKKCGKMTMSKPCNYCMRHIKEAMIKKVRYTDWDGAWKEIDL